MMISSRVRAGFSFIEIVVSLMIIGVMVAGAIGLFSWVDKARRTRTDTSLQHMKLAITSFNSDTGAWPASLTELLVRPAAPTVAKRWRGPYIEEQRELEDGWGHEFVYHLNPKGSPRAYELYSWGKNGDGSPQEEWISVWTS